MAAGDAVPFPKKNTAYRVYFPLLDADGDLVTGASSPDSERSLDGGTFADCTNEATEVATNSGMYFLDLTAAEMNTDCTVVIIKSGTAGMKTTPIVLYTVDVLYDDMSSDVTEIAAAADALESELSQVLSDTLALTGAVSDVESNLLIQTAAVSDIESTLLINTGAVSDVESNLLIQTAAVSDLESHMVVLDTNVSDVKSELVLASVANSNLESHMLILDTDISDVKSDLVIIDQDTSDIKSDTTRLELALITATGALEGTPTTTVLQTDLAELTDDHYNNMVFIMTSGDEAGQARRISDYTGSTGTVTLGTALIGAAPSSTETFAILNIPAIGEAKGFSDILSDLIVIDQDTSDLKTNVLLILSDASDILSHMTVLDTDVSNVKSELVLASVANSNLESHMLILDTNISDVKSELVIASTETVVIKSDVALPVFTSAGRIDANVEAINDNTEAAVDLKFSAATIVRGAAEAGTLSTTVATTDLTEATDEHYNGRIVIWTSGVLKDQASDITAYLGATGQLTYTAMTEAPTATDTFVIV